MFNYQYLSVSLIGLAAFGCLVLYDWLTIKKIRYRVVWAFVGYGMQVLAIILAAIHDSNLFVGTWFGLIGWIFLGTGVVWLLYCLYFFKPIRATYWDSFGPHLTTAGPYAICRHPGVYGYIVFILGLALVCRSQMLLFVGIFWSMINVIYVYLQDRYIFAKLFSGYEEYRKETKMLIPTMKGLKRFWVTK